MRQSILSLPQTLHGSSKILSGVAKFRFLGSGVMGVSLAGYNIGFLFQRDGNFKTGLEPYITENRRHCSGSN